MPTPPPADKPAPPRLPGDLHLSDLQGLAQLATQAMLGVAGLAENVQGNVYRAVASFFGPQGQRFIDGTPGSSGVKKRGITGRVYGSIRGVTRLAGGAAGAVLSGLAPLTADAASSPRREAVLSAVNGVLGDRLLETANPLRIAMRLRHEGLPLRLEADALAQRLPRATGKVLVLLHGLCMNDLQWRTSGAAGAPQPLYDHGLLLAAQLGYTPLYLHYNTGLHTSANGVELSSLLEQLLAAWPGEVTELTLLCHSMGGLVARSAVHQAEQSGAAWRGRLAHMIFLGTPHHGAPLERVGNWVDTVLGSNLSTRPFAKIGQIRSSGITDLRYGHVLASSWEGKDRFARSPDGREPLPLPPASGPGAVRCHAVAATTSARPDQPVASMAGDGLVPLASALGQHVEARHLLAFAPEDQWIARGVNHMELLSRPEVGAQLVRWCAG